MINEFPRWHPPTCCFSPISSSQNSIHHLELSLVAVISGSRSFITKINWEKMFWVCFGFWLNRSDESWLRKMIREQRRTRSRTHWTRKWNWSESGRKRDFMRQKQSTKKSFSAAVESLSSSPRWPHSADEVATPDSCFSFALLTAFTIFTNASFIGGNGNRHRERVKPPTYDYRFERVCFVSLRAVFRLKLEENFISLIAIVVGVL